MEFNLLPDVQNTGFIIMEIGLFNGGEHFFGQHGHVYREWQRVKTLQILVKFF